MAGIHDVAKSAGVKADVVVDVFEAVFGLVKDGERVQIQGFGSFEKRKFGGRTLVSPIINDGVTTKVGQSYRIGFKQSAQAKLRMNMKRKSRGKLSVRRIKKDKRDQ